MRRAIALVLLVCAAGCESDQATLRRLESDLFSSETSLRIAEDAEEAAILEMGYADLTRPLIISSMHVRPGLTYDRGCGRIQPLPAEPEKCVGYRKYLQALDARADADDELTLARRNLNAFLDP